MGKADWTNMVPGSGGTTDYIPSNKKEEVEDDKMTEVNLRGKIEFKKKNWFQRTLSSIRKNWPEMLLTVAIPEMGKILITKSFDILYSSIFNEPYSGGSSRRGRGYFFGDSRTVDYSDFYNGRNKNDSRRGYSDHSNKMPYDEFLFTNRLDAEEVIGKMLVQAREDGKVSVSDLYSIIRKTLRKYRYPEEIIALLETDQYTNQNFGWYYEDLRTAKPGVAGKDRYYLDLPEETAIR